MNMKAASIVALLTIHLTTVVSTDCDTKLSRCRSISGRSCITGVWLCKQILERCDHWHGVCLFLAAGRLRRINKSINRSNPAEAEIILNASEVEGSTSISEIPTESARSEMESSSGAFEVERDVSTSEDPTDCDYELTLCIKTQKRRCTVMRTYCAPWSTCRPSYDKCKADVIERTSSESTLSAFEVERDVSASKDPTVCDSERRLCFENEEVFCNVWRMPCLTRTFRENCLRSYQRCKANASESARSEVESISRAYEVEGNASSSGNPAEGVRSEAESNSSTSEVDRDASSSENPAEINPSAAESSVSLSEAERNATTSENPSECYSELDRCVANTWDRCLSPAESCPQIIKNCLQSYDLCVTAETGTENTLSEVETSSSEFEVERSASSSENLTGNP